MKSSGNTPPPISSPQSLGSPYEIRAPPDEEPPPKRVCRSNYISASSQLTQPHAFSVYAHDNYRRWGQTGGSSLARPPAYTFGYQGSLMNPWYQPVNRDDDDGISEISSSYPRRYSDPSLLVSKTYK